MYNLTFIQLEPFLNERANILFADIKSSAISIDGLHPIYRDTQFINDLISYFEFKEEYEKCKYLLMIRKGYSF
jgi:hypothetical protein